MNRTHVHDHNQDHNAEALNAYLDGLTSFDPAPITDLSSDMHAAVTRLYALAAAAGPHHDRQEHPLNATTAAPLSIDPITVPTPRRSRTLRRVWTHSSGMAQVAATATVILLTVLASFGVFRAFAPSGGGYGNGEGEDLHGAVPVATVPEDTVTSSLPYPTTAECTATPRTREEMTALLRTPPSVLGWNTSNPTQNPDQATSDEILALYRHWQACTLVSPYHRYSAELMTDEGIRFEVYNGPFNTLPKPLTDAAIEQHLAEFDLAATSNATPGGTMHQVTNATGTPVALAQVDKFPVSTIFPEDLYFSHVDLAVSAGSPAELGGSLELFATAYQVNPTTREVLIRQPDNVAFAVVDGRWLVIAERQILAFG